jgi:hypothetical protein
MFPQLGEKLAAEIHLSISISGESDKKSRVSRRGYCTIGHATCVILLATYRTIRYFNDTAIIRCYGNSYEHQREPDCTYENYLSRTDCQLLDPKEHYTLKQEKVACWQNEGVWVADLIPVELAHLGINRSRDTQNPYLSTRPKKISFALVSVLTVRVSGLYQQVGLLGAKT